MRLDRMLGITMELLTKRRVTATDLAARFEVSIRTIYRDIEQINLAGIPVVSFTGMEGGFEIMDGFFLSKQHFSVHDFSTIYNLLKGLEGTVGETFTTLIHKLGSLHPALLRGEYEEPILFDICTSEYERPVVRSLFEAVHLKKRVLFSYMDSKGNFSRREVEPIRLYWERGVWYLEAYCLLRNDMRFFRIPRLTELQVKNETFLPRTSVAVPEDNTVQVQGMQLHLRFDLETRPRVMEQFHGKYVANDNYIDVFTIVYTKDYALSMILSYGSKVEIISPSELKEDLLKIISEIQLRYNHHE